MTRYNDLLEEAAPFLKDHRVYRFKMDVVPGNANTMAITQKHYFDQAHANALTLRSILEGEIGRAEDESHRLRAFIQSKLRKAVHGTPEKEHEIQNSIETLLIGRGLVKGLDYDRETGRVKTSGKECVPDFIFPDLKLCLEIKLITSQEKLKTVIDEINADIRMYAKTYERQLFIVYDLGVIRDEEEFKHDLERSGSDGDNSQTLKRAYLKRFSKFVAPPLVWPRGSRL